MDWRKTPVFLTNWNNLDTGFRDMVDWFLNQRMRVTVLDNKSSYAPLLNYYQDMSDKIEVVHVGKNAGTWAFWQEGFNTEQACSQHYITSDADCPPDVDCPADLVEKMIAVLEAFPNATKVSPGIRLDNLPDCYARKQAAIDCQRGLSNSPLADGRHPDIGYAAQQLIEVSGLPRVYRSITDTTMTLWRGGIRKEGRLSTSDWQDEQYRMDAPYLVKHVPWYSDSMCPTAEARFYRNAPDKTSGPIFGI